MTIHYWNKVKKSNIKYSCNYKIPLLLEEILFHLTFINEKNI